MDPGQARFLIHESRSEIVPRSVARRDYRQPWVPWVCLILLTQSSKLVQVPKALEARNNVAIFCRSIDVSLLDELVCLTAFSNRRAILAHKDPLPK